MENMVNIYLFGKQYSVPASLTIMKAMEYAGYQLIRGCGCRNGFCGACATIYRIKGEQELKTCLACQTQVQEGMFIATLPFFPLVGKYVTLPNGLVFTEFLPLHSLWLGVTLPIKVLLPKIGILFCTGVALYCGGYELF